MKIELLQELLIIAICSGAIMTMFIQKIKEGINIKDSRTIVIVSFILNMIVGSLFAITFSEVNLINAIWVGFFSFIGADLIYKTLEEKVFKSFAEINKEEEIKYDL